MSFNKVIISGRLTSDPEIRSTNTGVNVASFSVAVDDWIKSERYTSFINCVAFGKTADTLSQYTKKGQLIGVEGALRQSRWDDKDGSKRSRIEVVANRVEIFEWNRNQEQGNAGNNNAASNNAKSSEPSYTDNPAYGDFIEDELDIPF